MKSLFYDSDSNLIALSEELQRMEKYIESHKVNMNKKVSLTYHIIGECEDYKVEPLLFTPILDNAFKFGSDNVNESFIDIVFIIMGKQLQFKVTNRKLPFSMNGNTYSGSGLVDLKRRLDFFYPNSHYFKAEGTEEIFTVRMILQLKE